MKINCMKCGKKIKLDFSISSYNNVAFCKRCKRDNANKIFLERYGKDKLFK